MSQLFRQAGKWLQPLLRPRSVNTTALQRRSMHPGGGPPQEPMSEAELGCWMFGAGFLVAITIIPTWGLYNVPRWAKTRRRTD